ncbi:hypothetical protein [Nocardia wallacei]|uniref:hypothetical protein n=1 Tax=Nocardia wallacei TaxID=480035 RepID=UPI002454FC70|nr:hypothetical protein [Nocardia wallacei]
MPLVRQDRDGLYAIVAGYIVRPITSETRNSRALGYPRTGTRFAAGDRPNASHSGGPTVRVGGEVWYIDGEAVRHPAPPRPPSAPPDRPAAPAAEAGPRLRPRPHIPPPGRKQPPTSPTGAQAPAEPGGNDPDAMLAEFRALQRQIAAEIARYSGDENRVEAPGDAADHHDRLAELYRDASDLMATLDTHLTTGGPLPAAWTRR